MDNNKQHKQDRDNEKASIYNKYKRKPSLPIIAVVLLILSGYVFFFMSPRIFHKRSETLYTPIGEAQKLNDDITLTVKKWSYSKKQNLMEVLLDVKNTSLQINNTDFSYYAVCNYIEESKGSYDCVVKPKIVDFNYLSLWIYDVPKEFNSCALYIYIDKQTSTPDSTEDTVPVQIYTSIDKVEKVKTIKDKTFNEYKIEEYEREIKKIENQIKDNDDTIDSLYKDISKLKKIIEKTKKAEIYQSETEIEKSETLINGYKDDIKDKDGEISTLKQNNTSLYRDIDEYMDLISKIKKKKE